MTNNNNESNLDKKLYKRVSISDPKTTPWDTNSYTEQFPEKMAQALIDNKIPVHSHVSSNTLRKDLAEKICLGYWLTHTK